MLAFRLRLRRSSDSFAAPNVQNSEPIMPTRPSLIPAERIEKAIHLLRGQKVMLDTDLAALYHVEVRAPVQAVKRNMERFPEDFMFQLTREEYAVLRSQTVILKKGRGLHRKFLPYVFAEQGVAML